MNVDTINNLIEEKILPSDSEIISSHNNIVISSKLEHIVARIGLLSVIKSLEDPGDIVYSHLIANKIGDAGHVVKPTTETPDIYGDVVVSKYPLMKSVDWNRQDPLNILEVVTDFNSQLDRANKNFLLRELDIPKYTRERINVAEKNKLVDESTLEHVRKLLEKYEQNYPFSELSDSMPGLVHGDLHENNFVIDELDNLKIIDLDSSSRGPFLYDVASWRFRQMLGDHAPVDLMIARRRQNNFWNKESFRALIGWKALSSITHVMRYETDRNIIPNKIVMLGRCAINAGALGKSDTLSLT